MATAGTSLPSRERGSKPSVTPGLKGPRSAAPHLWRYNRALVSLQVHVGVLGMCWSHVGLQRIVHCNYLFILVVRAGITALTEREGTPGRVVIHTDGA